MEKKTFTIQLFCVSVFTFTENDLKATIYVEQRDKPQIKIDFSVFNLKKKKRKKKKGKVDRLF